MKTSMINIANEENISNINKNQLGRVSNNGKLCNDCSSLIKLNINKIR